MPVTTTSWKSAKWHSRCWKLGVAPGLPMKNRLWWSCESGGAGEDADLVADMVGHAKAEPVDIELHAPVGVIAPEHDVADRARLAARREIHAAVDRPLRRQAGDVERRRLRVIGDGAVVTWKAMARPSSSVVCSTPAASRRTWRSLLSSAPIASSAALSRTPQMVSRPVAPATLAGGSDVSVARRS